VSYDTFIGIDPGHSGAIAIIGPLGRWHVMRCSETEHDLAEHIRDWGQNGNVTACIESVHSMPKQGVSSSFKFGSSFGFLRGLLTAHRVPFDMVTPQKWQKIMGCMTKGDKNVSKAAAQRLWPSEKIVHATADAMLIAEYCRRTKGGE
jgi:hypothetical protein